MPRRARSRHDRPAAHRPARRTATAATRRSARSGPARLRLHRPRGGDPYRLDADVKKLTGPSGLYRLRGRRFRIAYRINDGELVVLVVGVGDRRDVHRNLCRPTRHRDRRAPPLNATGSP
ncbi:type II toxin-antitoxin system RelE/ParE family toxin [Streptomyces sp. NBC_01216]|nr:type II toxin-antitoxin system RelE/ParE family toxin [Streptomyces sp. NBC_01216]